MNQDASSPLTKTTVVFTVVTIVASISSLVFGRTLHMEPVGLFGFGVFCLGYGIVISSVTAKRHLKHAETMTAPTPRGEQRRPVIVRETRTSISAPIAPTRPVHALTVDLEDYFHTEVASQGVSLSEWDQMPSRVEASTHRLLDLLETHRTRATFFVLGWVAKRYPRLIAEIHQHGHEIGCHSLDHQLVCRMKPADFYENTYAAKGLIESIIHEPVVGYRAPCFSITPGCEWAFDTLARLGFAYDSSVHPVHHPLYGNPTAPRNAYPVSLGRLMEFPIATWKLAGRNYSVGGGAYLRLLPYRYIHNGLKAWEKEMSAPAILYLHPWEIDPYQPYIPLSFQSKIRQTWGTSNMEEKLRQLFHSFEFAPLREVHRDVLEGKGHLLPQSVFHREPVSEQVAG